MIRVFPEALVIAWQCLVLLSRVDRKPRRLLDRCRDHPGRVPAFTIDAGTLPRSARRHLLHTVTLRRASAIENTVRGERFRLPRPGDRPDWAMCVTRCTPDAC